MKGDEKVIQKLNELLADELTAINQYMVHSEMCDDWGYHRLHEKTEKRAITEMKHAEALIGRIIFLEGLPVVSNLNPIHIGAEVEKQLRNDGAAEAEAIKMYNAGVLLAVDKADNGTRELLESILKDEEDHLDWIESQLEQIGQMGLPNYLAQQVE
jgi:bacterioferritin